MRKNKFFKILITITCFLPVVQIPSFAEDVVVKEVSLRDSYAKLLDEYDVLKDENAKSREIMKKLTKKIELFANNIRMGKEREALLLDQMGKEKTKFEQEKEELYGKIEQIKEEKIILESELAGIKEERMSDDTYKKLKESEKEVKKLTGILKDNAKKREKILEDTGKMHFNLATLYFEKGDYEKAANEYEESVKYLPEEVDAYYNLAIIYDFHLQDPDNASKNYRVYLEKEKKPDMLLWIKERIIDNDVRSKFIHKYRN